MANRSTLGARLMLAFAALFLIAGCNSAVEATLAVEGPIVEMTLEPRVIILVQAAPNVCGYRFLVDSRTEILRAGSILDTDIDDLRVGVRVRMWVAGDYRASCPATGLAARVVIMDG